MASQIESKNRPIVTDINRIPIDPAAARLRKIEDARRAYEEDEISLKELLKTVRPNDPSWLVD